MSNSTEWSAAMSTQSSEFKSTLTVQTPDGGTVKYPDCDLAYVPGSVVSKTGWKIPPTKTEETELPGFGVVAEFTRPHGSPDPLNDPRKGSYRVLTVSGQKVEDEP